MFPYEKNGQEMTLNRKMNLWESINYAFLWNYHIYGTFMTPSQLAQIIFKPENYYRDRVNLNRIISATLHRYSNKQNPVSRHSPDVDPKKLIWYEKSSRNQKDNSWKLTEPLLQQRSWENLKHQKRTDYEFHKEDQGDEDVFQERKEKYMNLYSEYLRASYSEENNNEKPEELVLNKLREWRKKRAVEENIPTYIIMKDSELMKIAEIKPGNRKAFKKIKGIGEKKTEKYYEELSKLLEK